MVTIYVLEDPTGIRYVGITSRTLAKRLACHIWEAARGDRYVHRWLRGLPDAPTIRAIEAHPDRASASLAERRWIRRLRKHGVRLTNTAPGGEGNSGPKSAETRAKMAAAARGRVTSEETRAKMRAAWERRRENPNDRLLNPTPELSARFASGAVRRGRSGPTSQSAESRERISAGLRLAYAEGRRGRGA
jgi:predicted GIY-YIG superfamily endonuclease